MPTAASRLRGMRFAHLIETDGPGGAERVLANLATEFQTAGSDNVVIVPERGEGWLARELRGTGVHVESFCLDRPFSPMFARRLADILRSYGVALAHSHEFTMAVYGTWAARRAGIPHVFTMHGSRYYAERWRRRIALWLATRMSDAVVTVSHSLARQLRRDLLLSADRLITIPNGVRHFPTSQSSLRQELGLADTDQLVVAVGNLYPIKGHTYLLQALALLAPRLPRLHVAIAGRGELASPLRAHAAALNVHDRFHLLGLRSDIGNVLSAADVFVLPSLSEGVPLALLEAMLAAKPIVATAVGEVPTVLDGGRAGLLVPSADASALANALASVLVDLAYGQRLGLAAATRAGGEYSLDAMVDRYAALYAKYLSPAYRPDPLCREFLNGRSV